MKKGFLKVAATVLTATTLALTGCSSGPSAEEVIRQGVDAEFSQVKSLDEKTLQDLTDETGKGFTQLEIDAKDYFKSFMNGFDYKIDGVDVDRDAGTAVAHVTVSCKSLQAIMNDFTSEFMNEVSSLDLTDASEDKIYAMAGETLTKVTDEAQPRDVQVDLPVSKDSDGNWSLDDGAEDQIVSAMFGE